MESGSVIRHNFPQIFKCRPKSAGAWCRTHFGKSGLDDQPLLPTFPVAELLRHFSATMPSPTGCDFTAIATRDYRSASAALKSEWEFWRETAPRYGFGRTELMPIKSTAEGISKYVGKYIAKHIDARIEKDKGAILGKGASHKNAPPVRGRVIVQNGFSASRMTTRSVQGENADNTIEVIFT